MFEVNDEEKGLIEKFGISLEHKTIYLYKGHSYDNIKDAINYARIDAESEKQKSNL